MRRQRPSCPSFPGCGRRGDARGVGGARAYVYRLFVSNTATTIKDGSGHCSRLFFSLCVDVVLLWLIGFAKEGCVAALHGSDSRLSCPAAFKD